MNECVLLPVCLELICCVMLQKKDSWSDARPQLFCLHYSISPASSTTDLMSWSLCPSPPAQTPWPFPVYTNFLYFNCSLLFTKIKVCFTQSSPTQHGQYIDKCLGSYTSIDSAQHMHPVINKTQIWKSGDQVK